MRSYSVQDGDVLARLELGSASTFSRQIMCLIEGVFQTVSSVILKQSDKHVPSRIGEVCFLSDMT